MSGTNTQLGAYLGLNSANSTLSVTTSTVSSTSYYTSLIGATTLTAPAATLTVTNASSLYIAGPPIASTNVSATNIYSVLVNSGVTKLASTLTSSSSSAGSLVLSGGLSISNTSESTSSTVGGTFTTAGGAAIAKDLYVGNSIYLSETSGNQSLFVGSTTTGNGGMQINSYSSSSTNTGEIYFNYDGENNLSVLSGHSTYGMIWDTGTFDLSIINNSNTAKFTSTGQLGLGLYNFGYSVYGALQVTLDSSTDPGSWNSNFAVFGKFDNTGSANTAALGLTYNSTNDYSHILSVAPSVGWKNLKISSNECFFYTNGTERLRIDSSGNVGIRTTSPSSSLQVAGGSSDILILGEGDNASGNTQLHFGVSAASSGYSTIQSINSSGTTGGDLSINPDGGNVGMGIGNTVPNYNLSVGTVNPFGYGILALSAGDENQNSVLYLGTPLSGDPLSSMKTAIIAEGQGQWSTSKLHFSLNGDLTSNDIGQNATVSHSRMTVTRDGFVGIGTTSPSTRLQIHTPTDNGGDTPSGPETALKLYREGVSEQSYPNVVDFNISRFDTIGDNALTQLDIKMNNGLIGTSDMTALTLRSNGNVGVGTTSPSSRLHVYKSSSGDSSQFLIDLTPNSTPSTVVAKSTLNWYGASFDTQVFRGNGSDITKVSMGINLAENITIRADGNIDIGAGNVKIQGTNYIEFGTGETKESNSGKIGYETFDAGYLNIIGAGTTAGSRNVKIYDNVLVAGNIDADGTIAGSIWKSPNFAGYISSSYTSLTVSGATTLPAAYCNAFFGLMIEFTGSGGTLTTATATDIVNYESSNPLVSRGGITTIYNGTSGTVTFAAGTGVTIRGTLAIPSGKTATARIAIFTTTDVRLHLVLSA
jgi:trimeric autotransporter adhesin